jgi:NAD(P)-dependent dehydrogenase (short-subunit alcohol dehydrogenase family)
MKRLQDKVAVITGGNSGIGKGIAKRFLEEGAKVVIFGRQQQSLDQTQQELQNQILTVQGDVTNTNDLKNLYEQTRSHYGKIDILVANAGVSGKRMPINEVTETDFDTLLNINYRGAFFTARYALDYLNAEAAIIFIASCSATITLKNHSLYAPTKAAIAKLTRNLAYDLAEKQIRVNSISPGYVKTPLFDKRLQADPDYLRRKEKNIPLKRIGSPQDIANAAVFLASAEAAYITGIDLLVDGGMATAFPEE